MDVLCHTLLPDVSLPRAWERVDVLAREQDGSPFQQNNIQLKEGAQNASFSSWAGLFDDLSSLPTSLLLDVHTILRHHAGASLP